jgi:site-specific DNA-methyltransferase (adenine-specific)
MRDFKGTRNCRSVWTIATQPYRGAHFATFPPELAERCIKAGSKPGDTILDPFSGAGTTCLVADRLGRDGIGIELYPAYSAMAHERVVDDCPLFAEVVIT